MKASITEVRNLIEQTRGNLERLGRICDHCFPVVKNGAAGANELVSTLEQQNYDNLRRIFSSLKILERGEKYRDSIEQLKAEADGLKEDYNFVGVQYSLN